ncbi:MULTISPECIES: LPXTG cell wall anchor domain-containing protein [unclassified Streptomyces]|uniref:LPXTG cell wall anchor domain-containing protein n=1 Tax=unclassified Streptomyces TaxID=2593676 RepID=UPI0036EFAD7D
MVAASAGLVLTVVSPATAADTATGPEGQKLTVSRSAGLDPAGETVTVSGTGYNTEKGIYVAFCVDNGAGRTPTPCVGGVDMSGESGASVWVSSDPPSYGEGLAEPYKGSGHDGSFSVRLKVRAEDANTDCTKPGVTCAVITRNDHTRGGDQSQTVRIPVTFGGAGSSTVSSAPSASATASTTGGGGATGGSGTTGSESTSDGPLASTGSTALTAGLTAAGLVAAGTGTWLWARRRRTATNAG